MTVLVCLVLVLIVIACLQVAQVILFHSEFRMLLRQCSFFFFSERHLYILDNIFYTRRADNAIEIERWERAFLDGRIDLTENLAT